jgi:hypothetical protein
MIIYSLCTCDRCGERFATHPQAQANAILVYRLGDLNRVVAEVGPGAPLACPVCASGLEVAVPCAVRTQAGDWLALELKHVECAFAN